MSPLISVAELADALPAGNPPTLLDVRWSLTGPPGRDLYQQGHLPGAAFVDLDEDLADHAGGGGRHPLPDPERFAAAMRRCGVRAGRPVVVYDAGSGTSAARAWWLLRYHGHQEVRLLDGGLRAWQAAGRPVTTAAADPVPGDFTPTPGGMPVLDAVGAAELALTGVLLDARAAERYRGEVEPIDPVAGHIPGAVNAPTEITVDGDGRLLPADELLQRFDALGARPGASVGAYCGSGVTASQLVLALEVAGVRAALYPGSWSEWVSDRTRPVATGESS